MNLVVAGVILGLGLMMVGLTAAAVIAVVRFRRHQDLRSRRSTIEAALVMLDEPYVGAGLPDPAQCSGNRRLYAYARGVMDAELAVLNLRMANAKAATGDLGPDEDPRPLDPTAWG